MVWFESFYKEIKAAEISMAGSIFLLQWPAPKTKNKCSYCETKDNTTQKLFINQHISIEAKKKMRNKNEKCFETVHLKHRHMRL